MTDLDEPIIFDADNEEPSCMRCDYFNLAGLESDTICDKCGPEYGWAYYRRTTCWKYVLEELRNLVKEANK